MGLLSRFWDDTYIPWFGSVVTCCLPQVRAKARHRPPGPVRSVEPHEAVHYDQPRLISPPVPEPRHSRSPSREWLQRTRSAVSRASTRASFSVKRQLNAYNGSRRPQIGAPTDFRHVQNAVPRRTEEFTPLELSIYSTNNRLSPLFVHLGGVEDEGPVLVYPPAALHARSPSTLSNFSIPRKPLNSRRSAPGLGADARTSASSEWVTHPLRPRPSVPESLGTHELLAALEEEVDVASPPTARQRSYTEPPQVVRPDSELFERVKSILQEKAEIEKQIRDIDSVIEERRSVYLSSRPPSALSARGTIPDFDLSELEPMPRPRTSPSLDIDVPSHKEGPDEESYARSIMDRPDRAGSLPPPLPLVLHRTHPPLRKKKSFSHVSGWLNRAEQHTRRISIDSVTNTPFPIKSREGFYQSIDPDAGVSPNVSPIEETVQTPTEKDTEQSDRGITSRASVSTVSSLDSRSDKPTEPTPNSSPGRPQTSQTLELTRVTTFGDKQEEAGLVTAFGFGTAAGRLSRVGVAF